MDEYTPKRGLTRTGIAAAAIMALALLMAPTAAEAAKDGTAIYQYKVTEFDYSAAASLAAGRGEETCEAGRTASWVGQLQSGVAELAQLDKYGDGHLFIGSHGTTGKFTMRTEIESSFGPSEHTLVTACCPPEGSPSCVEGQQIDYATTPCADGPKTSTISGGATIESGVGNRIKISWAFRQLGAEGRWVPDIFRCVEEFDFPFGACSSRAKLDAFTKKRLTLPFKCAASVFTPPPGDYSQYGAMTSATGSIGLTRTGQG